MTDPTGGAPAALWHLTLPWERPPILANDTGKLAAQMSVKRRTRDDMAQVARSLRIQPVRVPVAALLTWYRRTERVADSDNIAPTLKRVLDGLVLAGVLAGDTPQYVPLTMQRVIPRTHNPWSSGTERVVLSLFAADSYRVVHIYPSPSGTFADGAPTP